MFKFIKRIVRMFTKNDTYDGLSVERIVDVDMFTYDIRNENFCRKNPK